MLDVKPYLRKIKIPSPTSHKGQNGKLLIIGGSELFHAASKWSLDIASKFVDMVFYASIPSNNDLVREAKGEFWNGIVISRDDLESYLQEADCILIGPGMEREQLTAQITNDLITKFPQKKWVIDAGALQMINSNLINEKCIITPHQKELERLPQDIANSGVTILLKGHVDKISHGGQTYEIEGGNGGMAKGGTGDVLAGLVAALYCTHDALTSAVVGSYINKKSGEYLYKEVGPYFNASDLVKVIPQVMWQEIDHFQNHD